MKTTLLAVGSLVLGVVAVAVAWFGPSGRGFRGDVSAELQAIRERQRRQEDRIDAQLGELEDLRRSAGAGRPENGAGSAMSPEHAALLDRLAALESHVDARRTADREALARFSEVRRGAAPATRRDLVALDTSRLERWFQESSRSPESRLTILEELTSRKDREPALSTTIAPAAAEWLRVETSPSVRRSLIALLNDADDLGLRLRIAEIAQEDESRIVREQAVGYLARYVDQRDVLLLLERIAEHDPSDEVRRAAGRALAGDHPNQD